MNTSLTLPDGRVEVNGSVPELPGGISESVWRWFPAAKFHEERTGVPAHWTLGTIHAESGGNPAARSGDGGLGLMQITSSGLKQGLSDDQVMVPENNLKLGTDFLRILRGSGPASARELPAVASRYNAGQKTNGAPHPANNAWGMRATGNHIDRVVAAANSARARELAEGGEVVSPPPEGGGSGDPLPGFPDDAARSLLVELSARVGELEKQVRVLIQDLADERAARLVRTERVLRAALNAVQE
jgi:hypothetical protein